MRKSGFSARAAMSVVAVGALLGPRQAISERANMVPGAHTGPPDSQEVQVPAPALPLLQPLAWKLPERFASLEGNRLVIDVPREFHGADAMARAILPAALHAGAKGFAISVDASGSHIAQAPKHWLGLKVQLHWKDRETGQEGHPNCRGRTGSFGRTKILTDALFNGATPDFVEIMLGLQGTSGRVEFDLGTLRGAASEGVFRRINQNWRVRHPEGFADDRPRMGCMLPARETTEDDIETLHRWGATMARFQMIRHWKAVGDNQDLAEFAAWVDSRLDNLEDVLRWAAERGMKICVDLHVTPGGRDFAREHIMFRDERYADAFVDTWRRIAARFCGHPALYGYDLLNEPLQRGRAAVDYWTLQRRAAEAIREIDPVTPVVIESNNSDSPGAYRYLSPLEMDNVIYQVHFYEPGDYTHQGVGGKASGFRWPDPARGWDVEYLRRVLEPVRDFQLRHGARIYVGEFSAICWAEGAENYLRDCIGIFREYGWDWTYHAFREWEGWSVEHEGPDASHLVPSADNPRKRALLDGLKGGADREPSFPTAGEKAGRDVPASR